MLVQAVYTTALVLRTSCVSDGLGKSRATVTDIGDVIFAQEGVFIAIYLLYFMGIHCTHSSHVTNITSVLVQRLVMPGYCTFTRKWTITYLSRFSVAVAGAFLPRPPVSLILPLFLGSVFSHSENCLFPQSWQWRQLAGCNFQFVDLAKMCAEHSILSPFYVRGGCMVNRSYSCHYDRCVLINFLSLLWIPCSWIFCP